MVTVVVLAAASLLVLLAAAVVTSLLRPEGRLDAAVTAGVTTVVLVSTAVLLTGWVGALAAGPLLAVAAVQATLALWLRHRTTPRTFSTRVPRLTLGELRGAPWESALVAAAGLALGWQLLVALVLPPYAYDALTYHLTTVAGWVQSESLAPSELSLCCAYYPLNAELPTAWLMVLTGTDALVGVPQVLAALLGAAAVAGIGRTAGLRRRSAAAAGALFVLTPAVLAQAPTPYVDVLLAALTLAGLHGLARFAATARLSRLVLPALCAGLLTGTKGTGPLWGIALAVTATGLAVLHVRRGRLPARQTAAGLAGVAATCLLLGAWWYVRSAIDTGNPLHPFQVRVGGATVFDGPARVSDVLTRPERGSGYPWPVAVLLSWAADLLPWQHGSYDYQQRSGGLGPLWPWLGLPLLLVGGLRLWRERNAALAAVIPVLALLLLQPYRWWARFTLPLAALGILAVLLVLEQQRRAVLRRGLRAAVAGLAAVGAALVLVEVDPASRAEPLPALRVPALVGAPAEDRTLGRLFLPEYRFLEQVPDDATVAVDLETAGLRFVYPLFGSDLGRTVVRADDGPPPADAWVVTGDGRPLAAELTGRRGAPVFAERGLQVWAPVGGPPLQ